MTKRILIVDDNPSVLETVELILSEAGYSVCAVDSGGQCLVELRNGFKGLILMDIMMPEMDGWDTIAALVDEGLFEGNVICMLTAVHDPGAKLESLKECVLDYVTKPFTSEELLTAVEDSICYIV
jgi:CheY-like chemotaxis protein